MSNLDTRTIDLVRSSWALVAPDGAAVAALFYRKLLALDPSLQPMFGGDMTVQGQRLTSMIGAALSLLDRPAALQPVLHGLGARHAGYGVREPHYGVVGAALLQTLQEGLGTAFTDDVHAAWAAVYGVLASEMQAGAQAGRPAGAQAPTPPQTQAAAGGGVPMAAPADGASRPGTRLATGGVAVLALVVAMAVSTWYLPPAVAGTHAMQSAAAGSAAADPSVPPAAQVFGPGTPVQAAALDAPTF